MTPPLKPCDIVDRLSGTTISDAFNDGRITSGVFAEQLITDRHDARDEILRLRAEIESLRRSSAWRPISEAPRDGTEILAYRDGFRRVSWWTKGWFHAFIDKAPTHFQPLPTPPEGEDGVAAEDGSTAGAPIAGRLLK